MRPVPAPDPPRFAVILAGGSGRRLGEIDKPGLLLDGRRLVDIALAAVEPALTVVVGPDRALPVGTLRTREDPPGGGPAAALLEGLLALSRHGPTPPEPARRGLSQPREDASPGPDELVVVLASDLPGIDRAAVTALVAAVRLNGVDGAVLTDPGGRLQYLAGVWRWQAVLESARRRPSWHGGRVSDLLGPLIGITVPADAAGSADVDRPEDLVRWHVAPPESGTPDDGS